MCILYLYLLLEINIKLKFMMNNHRNCPFSRHPKKVPKVAQLAAKLVQKDHDSSLSNNALTRAYRHNEWRSKL
jgi:hypothetical protein